MLPSVVVKQMQVEASLRVHHVRQQPGVVEVAGLEGWHVGGVEDVVHHPVGAEELGQGVEAGLLTRAERPVAGVAEVSQHGASPEQVSAQISSPRSDQR